MLRHLERTTNLAQRIPSSSDCSERNDSNDEQNPGGVRFAECSGRNGREGRGPWGAGLGSGGKWSTTCGWYSQDGPRRADSTVLRSLDRVLFQVEAPESNNVVVQD